MCKTGLFHFVLLFLFELGFKCRKCIFQPCAKTNGKISLLLTRWEKFFLPFKFLDIYQKHHKNIVVRVVHYLFFTKHSNRRSQEFWNFLRLFIYLSQFILNISFGINRTIIRNCKMNCCNHCKVGRNQLFAETMLLYICMS